MQRRTDLTLCHGDIVYLVAWPREISTKDQYNSHDSARLFLANPIPSEWVQQPRTHLDKVIQQFIHSKKTSLIYLHHHLHQ